MAKSCQTSKETDSDDLDCSDDDDSSDGETNTETDWTLEETMQFLSVISRRGKMEAALKPAVIREILRKAMVRAIVTVGTGLAPLIRSKRDSYIEIALADFVPNLQELETHGAGADGDSAVETRKKTPTFQPIHLFIEKLPFKEKMQLYNGAIAIIQNLGCRNMNELKNKVTGNSDLEKKFQEILKDYIINDLKGEVKQGQVAYIGHGAGADGDPTFFDKLIHQHIGNVSSEEKRVLYNHAFAIAQKLGCKNMVELENLVKDDRELIELLVKKLTACLSNNQMS